MQVVQVPTRLHLDGRLEQKSRPLLHLQSDQPVPIHRKLKALGNGIKGPRLVTTNNPGIFFAFRVISISFIHVIRNHNVRSPA